MALKTGERGVLGAQTVIALNLAEIALSYLSILGLQGVVRMPAAKSTVIFNNIKKARPI